MKATLFLFLLLSLSYPAKAPGKWELVKEQDGIKMYNRPSERSKFNDIKVEAEFPGTVQQIAEILLDVPKYTEWAYATKSSVIVKKISNTELIYYSEIDVPWPANNRDFYAHCKATFDSSTHSMKLISVSIKNYQPEKKNIVRLAFSRGTWNITTAPNKKIRIEYFLELDPGGSVPAWLLNLFSTKGPMETFLNLKQKMVGLNK
ncbi:MAG: lipid-binding protein [Bacteroidetes bacterium]|nr:lipid-binding protein [Bacteroidota bacterium]